MCRVPPALARLSPCSPPPLRPKRAKARAGPPLNPLGSSCASNRDVRREAGGGYPKTRHNQSTITGTAASVGRKQETTKESTNGDPLGRRSPELHRRDDRRHDQLPRVEGRQLGRPLLASEGLHAGVHH